MGDDDQVHYSGGPSYSKAGLDEWASKDGRITKIKDLETPHLLSILAILHKTDGIRAPQQRNKIISLQKEVVKRFSK